MFFADLVGSTALGGSHDPEHTRDLLDRFYDAMAAEIALGGGTVEKFIGDAVVAVFGAPTAQEDHAERALQAALSMQLRLSELFGERLGFALVSTRERSSSAGRGKAAPSSRATLSMSRPGSSRRRDPVRS